MAGTVADSAVVCASRTRLAMTEWYDGRSVSSFHSVSTGCLLM